MASNLGVARRILFPVIVAIAAVPHSVHAQEPTLPDAGRAFTIGVELERARISEVDRCSFGGYVLPGLEIRSTGTFFVSGGAQIMAPWGAAASCLILPSVRELPDGRVLVRGSRHIEIENGGIASLGGGARVPLSIGAAEAEVEGGVVRGQEGFESDLLPIVAASVGLVLFEDVVVAVGLRSVRTPHWELVSTDRDHLVMPPESRPAGTTVEHTWMRVSEFSVGWRF